jgi:hypothetical protein
MELRGKEKKNQAEMEVGTPSRARKKAKKSPYAIGRCIDTEDIPEDTEDESSCVFQTQCPKTAHSATSTTCVSSNGTLHVPASAPSNNTSDPLGLTSLVTPPTPTRD